MKYKKITKYTLLALTVVSGFLFLSAPYIANAATGYDDTRRAGAGSSSAWERNVEENGYVGGAFNVAGNAVKDTFESLFGESGGDNEDVVSFINFKGGLSAPEGEGLDPTLTRAKTARDFIRNTLNFALSFLGIIALVIVVYGGFLYVTAAGNEEQSGKGKKAITYAAIGILIIVASFGLVNTLITSVGGEGAGGGGRGGESQRGAGLEGSNTDQQNIYNLSASAISSALNDFTGAYKNLLAVNSIAKKIKAFSAPESEGDNRNYLNQITGALTEIKNNTPALSKVSVEAKKLLDGWVAEKSVQNLSGDNFDNGQLKEEFDPKIAPLLAASKNDYDGIIDSLIGTDKKGGKLGIVRNVLGEISNTPYTAVKSSGLVNEKDLKRALSGIDPTKTIKDIFDDAIGAIYAAKTIDVESPNPTLIINVMRYLDRLFIIIRNVEFVFVKIRATVKEGNAPLVVELNGLESRDPTGATITDDRYEWDAMGTQGYKHSGTDLVADYGADVDSRLNKDVECKPGNTGPAITCTYNQPGTYIVRLKIRSQDPSQVATGQAFLPITVLPSVARIALSAKVGAITEDLRKYEQDSSGKWSLAMDKHELQVTSDEARGKGVSFDSSQSKGGGGAEITTYNWTFGDGSGNFDKAGPTIDHPYKNKGKYQLKLEVTDTGNRKDRVLVNVSVGSLAARILAPSEETEPDALVEFDGSTSRSDKGPISSYEWKIFEVKEGQSETEVKKEQISLVGDSASPSLRVRFKKSGSYKVTLTVNDGSEPKSDEALIFVKSRKPRANFFMRACPDDCADRFKPNVVALDASPSFDPDKDELLYAWTIIDEQGNELTKDQSFEVLGGKTLQDKIIQLRFFKPGKYKIQLGATDQLDARLQQTDLRTKEVTITSTVELKWDDMPISAKLTAASEGESPKAHFAFKGKVSNADKLTIDFGDNNADEQSLTAGKDVAFEFSHDYTEAKPFLVSLKATSDEGNGENTIPLRVYVQGGDTPLAVIEASIDNAPVILTDPAQDALEVIRRKTIKFSAENSLNSKGKPSTEKLKTLTYSWDFGDGSKNTDQNTQHSYENVSPETGPYKVTLTVADKDDSTKTNQSTFLVNVVSKKPQVNTLSIEKTTAGNATPVDIKLTAEGAMDPDGEIQSYQFWYFDPADRDRQLSPVITYGKENNFANLTIETNGEEGAEHEYAFCVSVTDKENTTSECHELFQDEELPKIKVANGPNNPPTADFTTDKNQVKLNEAVTFTANATDPDGTIAQYLWDFDGNGFQDDQPTDQATTQHTYTRQSRGSGYQVKLKVVDDKGAAGFSKAIPVVVSANSNPPHATFTCQVAQDNPLKVTCFDQSTADSANNARLIKWSWDFDTGKQYGCDSAEKPSYCNDSKTDDIDSTDQNPTFTYPAGETGRKQVQLTVEDSDGNTAESKIFVELRPGAVAVTEGGTRPNADILNAIFSAKGTRPGVQSRDVTIPGCSPAGSNECKHKVIHIPVTGTGTPATGENVSFFYGQSTGNISNYKIDKNIWCDADGDGDRTNDWDNQNNVSHGCEVASSGEPGENCWTTEYKRRAKTPGSPEGPGHFMARLRVEDASDPVNKYSNDDVEVIFDGATRPDEVLSGSDCNGNIPGSTGSASLFTKLGTQNTILLSLLAGVIVVLLGSGAASFFKRGKRRTH